MPTTESERTLSAVAHIGPILPMGLIVTLVILLTQANKSKFATRNARQALVWQLILLLVIMVVTAAYMPFYFSSFFQMMPQIGGPNSNAGFTSSFNQLFAMQFAAICVQFGVIGAFGIVGVIKALRALKGEPGVYPLIGAFIERRISQKAQS
ncbi:MAG: DUF4870 domain-containing protein [Thermoflexales bacterium]